MNDGNGRRCTVTNWSCPVAVQMVTAKLLSAKNSTKSWAKSSSSQTGSKSSVTIRKQLDAISKNGKFYVNLSKINIGAGAIADFRRQLNTVINTLNLDKGTSITLTAEGIGEVKSKIKETATVTDEAARKMAGVQRSDCCNEKAIQEH